MIYFNNEYIENNKRFPDTLAEMKNKKRVKIYCFVISKMAILLLIESD